MPNFALHLRSFIIPVRTRKGAGMLPPPSRQTLPGAFLVPASHSAFEYFTCVDLRRPFKSAKKWKRKRQTMAMQERLLQPSRPKRSLFRYIPSWKHYSWAKRKKTNPASGLGTEVSLVQANAMLDTPGRGCETKGYLRSLISIPRKRKDNQPCLSTGLKSSFTQTFTPKDGDSSTSPARSDVNPELANSCDCSSLADRKPPNDELEMNPLRLGRWGYWNDQDELSGDNQSNLKESNISLESNIEAHGHKFFAGIGKFQKVRRPLRGSRARNKRLQISSAPLCDAVEELDALHVEQHEKLNECLQLGEHTQRKVSSKKEEPIVREASVKMPCKKEGLEVTFRCFGHLLARSFQGKRSVVQKQLSDEGMKASTVEMHSVACSDRCHETCETDRAVPAAPVDLEEFFARLTCDNDPSTQWAITDFNTSDAAHLSSTPIDMQVLSIPANHYAGRSGNTPLAPSSARDDGNLAFLNAKMDSRFEQVLKAIDVVANQVKKSAESQQQMGSISDDKEESAQLRLLSSSITSELGTIETELSPSRNWVSQSKLLVKEFKEAVDDARFQMRLLAGHLTVEKDAKMASARAFQSKHMILTMGIIGAQMLQGEILLEKPWHMKYMLDSCVSSIFFNGPHSSSNCICSRPCSTRDNPRDNYRSKSYDLFCNDIEFASMTFDSLRDDATVSVEELVGSRTKDWSEALTNMFWHCAFSCFHVHKLIMAIHKGRRCRVQILHPDCGTRFDASAMDPLDTGDFKTFYKKVHFTIFSGFLLDNTVLCKSQVYLEPNVPAIRL